MKCSWQLQYALTLCVMSGEFDSSTFSQDVNWSALLAMGAANLNAAWASKKNAISVNSFLSVHDYKQKLSEQSWFASFVS